MSSTIGLGKIIQKEKNKPSGFMLISVDSSYYSKTIINKYCIWALEKLNKFLLVIVDIPQIYNYTILKRLSIGEAYKRAEKVGLEKQRAIEKIIKYLKTNRIKATGFKTIINTRRYQKMRNTIKYYFTNNRSFAKDLVAEMQQIIVKKVKKVVIKETYLTNFLIDEISAMLYLIEFSDYQIEISHYNELTILKNIYLEKYDNLLTRLELKRNYEFIQVLPA